MARRRGRRGRLVELGLLWFLLNNSQRRRSRVNEIRDEELEDEIKSLKKQLKKIRSEQKKEEREKREKENKELKARIKDLEARLKENN